MAVKIRLRQQGRKGRPFYRLILADSKSPRDGRYIETLGWYNPLEADLEKNLNIKVERVQHWIESGAVMTEKAESLVARVAPQVVAARKEREAAKRAKLQAKRKRKE